MESLFTWRVLQRRKGLVAGALLTVLLATFIGARWLPASYVAKAQVRYKKSEINLSFLSGLGLQWSHGGQAPGQAESTSSRIALATARPLLEQVAQALQLRNRQGELTIPGTRAGAIQRRLRPTPLLRLQAVPDTTDLIQIEGGSADPDEAAMLANTLADLFIQNTGDRARADYSQARQFVEQQIAAVRKAYLEAAEAMRDYKVATQTLNLENEIQTSIQRMTTLLQEKHGIINYQADVKARLAVLKKQMATETPDKVSNMALAENLRILELKRTVNEMESQLATALIEKTEAHPDVVGLKVRLAKAKEQLAAEIAMFQEAPATLKALERDLAAQEARLADVDQEMNRHAAVMAALPQKVYGEAPIGMKLGANQNLYNLFLSYLQQIGIAEAMLTSDIRLIESAEVPKAPKGKLSIYVMGVFLGLLCAAGLVLVAEQVDDTIKQS